MIFLQSLSLIVPFNRAFSSSFCIWQVHSDGGPPLTRRWGRSSGGTGFGGIPSHDGGGDTMWGSGCWSQTGERARWSKVSQSLPSAVSQMCCCPPRPRGCTSSWCSFSPGTTLGIRAARSSSLCHLGLAGSYSSGTASNSKNSEGFSYLWGAL